jgi:2-phosphoglycerate kinase
MSPDHPHGQELSHILWLGGTPCSGKTSVARRLAATHGLPVYHYDERAQAHEVLIRPERHPAMCAHRAMTLDERWVLRPVEAIVATTTAAWMEQFALAIDDLRALPQGTTVLAEGPGLLPDCVAPLLSSPRQALWLVPTEAFKRATQPTRGRAWMDETSDPARTYENLLALDLQLARDVKRRAGELGLRVIEVDGTRSVEEMAAVVAEHFALPLSAAGVSSDRGV